MIVQSAFTLTFISPTPFTTRTLTRCLSIPSELWLVFKSSLYANDEDNSLIFTAKFPANDRLGWVFSKYWKCSAKPHHHKRTAKRGKRKKKVCVIPFQHEPHCDKEEIWHRTSHESSRVSRLRRIWLLSSLLEKRQPHDSPSNCNKE